jgi:phosphopantothenoylcysteine decarboxylase/phosphopantothenate--cysteine ligase
MLKGKSIVLGVAGGIAVYKACELVRRMVEKGADVHVMMTKAAQEFVTPLSFQALSGHPVHTDLINLTQEQEIGHISLADRADAVVLAPATADLMAKIAHGFCDDLVTTVVCATRAPLILAPSMNVNMWNNAITQENIDKLRKNGCVVIEPDSGFLACGYTGKGRLPEPETIIDAIEKTLGKKKIHVT